MTAARMTAAELDAFLRTELPQMFNFDDLTIEHADGQTCRIRKRFRESMLRPGGTISGSTLMALAGCALYVAPFWAIGPVVLSFANNFIIQFMCNFLPGDEFFWA